MMNWVTYHGEDSSREMEESTAIPSEEDSNMNNEDPMFENADQNDANAATILEIESIPISPKSPLRQAAAAVDLLIHDNKMKYLSFINTTVSEIMTLEVICPRRSYLNPYQYTFSSVYALLL